MILDSLASWDHTMGVRGDVNTEHETIYTYMLPTSHAKHRYFGRIRSKNVGLYTLPL